MREVGEGLVGGLCVWRVRLAVLCWWSGRGGGLWLGVGFGLVRGGGGLGGQEGGIKYARVVEGARDVLFLAFLDILLGAASRR